MLELSVIRDKRELRSIIKRAQTQGKTIGLVPTMGYLHEGHLSLVRAARKYNDLVVVSIFVNPTQFGPSEDFAVYPRDEQRDLALCKSEGVDIVFIPSVEEMYPHGLESTWVEVNRLSEHLCGAKRPGHFRGVATVVAKLFNMVGADFAYFGKKDYQQYIVLLRMVSDLSFGVELVGCPIVRETDGLAMSSRNVRLGKEERAIAPKLYESLQAAQAAFRAGLREVALLKAEAEAIISSSNLIELEYLSIVDPYDLQLAQKRCGDEAVMLLAARIGPVRLIDNIRLDQ